MKNAYIIVFDPIVRETDFKNFIEILTSNFITKKGKSNLYIIAVDSEKNAKDIFDLVISKLNYEVNFLVVKLDNFYGLFDDANVVNWIKEHFPQYQWFNKP